jgi:transcription antitermination protein NusB
MTARRHQAREAALQILYFWEVGKTDPGQALEAYFREHQPEASDAIRTFASELVSGTVANLEAIDKLIEQHSANWRLARLASIDRLILRMATWELQHQPDVPAAVVLDEALELARTFSTDDSVRFVNGVLDAIRQGLGRA